ncbi:universal stress protein [Natrinema sp. LN54]|uniref:universal stress protein n=1 Tax=Natrinema sp. LN54 TaxID=3458705 RepID=UPI004035C32B
MGVPVPSILDVAFEIDAEYIVSGGRKRSSTGKALFGSTTQFRPVRGRSPDCDGYVGCRG